MEGVPKPVVESNENVVSLDAWKTDREHAPTEAAEMLAAHSLESDIEMADRTALEQIVSVLPGVMESLLSDNKNRFVERELRTKLELAKLKLEYVKARDLAA